MLPQEPEQLDPRLVADAYGLKLSRLLFESLVKVDPHTLAIVPRLAERVEILDATTYRVTLRPGLRFSDGSTLDVSDVLATYRSVLSRTFGSRFESAYRRIARIVRENSLTLVFHLREPHASFLTDLEFPILRAEDEHRAVGIGQQPIVSSGPYRLARLGSGRYRLTPNARWFAGRPRFPNVLMVVVRDDNTRALRLVAGGADLAQNSVPPLLLPLFEHRPGFRLLSSAGIGTTYLGFNTAHSPFSDVRVRRAIAHAIDVPTLIETKFRGFAHEATGWIPAGHWAFAGDVPRHRYDPALARALLDRAGLRDPDGRGSLPRLRCILRTSTDRFRLSVARAIASMLADVGIDVEVRPSEIATLLSDLNRGRFDMTTLQIPEVLDPHVLSGFFSSEKIPTVQKPDGANRWRFRSQALDRALEAGRATVDPARRREAYVRVQHILARDLPVIPLWHEDNVVVAGARAFDYTVPRDGRFATLAE